MQASTPDRGQEQTPDHRFFVGPGRGFDLSAALQFNLLTYLGLREDHALLDIGCGSLKAGRLFIPYLASGMYFGIEPVNEILQSGIASELGRSAIELKQPKFDSNGDFNLGVFGRKFDFLLAQSIFSHTSQAQLARCLSEAKKVMAPDAIFAASFFEGAENYEGDSWTVRATYSLARIKQLAQEAGLNCERIDWPHPDPQTWVLITHPDFRPDLRELTTTARILQLETFVEILQSNMERLQNHPWFKLGRGIRVLQLRVQFTKQLLVRRLTSSSRQP